jgi:NAD(P)-dependent dehydrogenase (short-subunit alcohol dehydrogenase family)
MSVNTVAPGAMHIPDDPNGHEHAMTSVDRIPMRRFGTADDVADAVWFFASCSPYITGQFIAVDGGYHLHR